MKSRHTTQKRSDAAQRPRVAAACAAGLLLSASGLSMGVQTHGSDYRHVAEYSRAQVLLQLNDTDGDLGFHARIDGEPWQRLVIEAPNHRRIFDVQPRRQLKIQGMTEIAFESHEPPFDELSPDAFFKRFPVGEYKIRGRTLDGRRLQSDALLSHVIPAPAINIMAGGTSIEFDCEDDTPPAIATPHIISWDPVTSSHPTIGPAAMVDPAGYELVVERVDGTPLKFKVNLPGDVTAFTLPSELVFPGDLLKVEVLVIAENGNETGREACFISGG